MSNYPCVQVLEVINVLSYKLLDLLQIMLFCSILQQIDDFLRKQPSWVNPECQIAPVYQFWKYSMYHLSSYYICCKLCYFAAFCSKLIIFWESNPPESIWNVKSPLYNMFSDYKWITYQNLQFLGFSSRIYEKIAATAAAAAATKIFWHLDLDPHTKWGKVTEFQKKIWSGLVVITEKL